MRRSLLSFFFFFFNDTATTEIYTLSLHDALPISMTGSPVLSYSIAIGTFRGLRKVIGSSMRTRSFSRVWTVKRFIAWHTLARGARRATGRRHVQPSAGMEGT